MGSIVNWYLITICGSSLLYLIINWRLLVFLNRACYVCTYADHVAKTRGPKNVKVGGIFYGWVYDGMIRRAPMMLCGIIHLDIRSTTRVYKRELCEGDEITVLGKLSHEDDYIYIKKVRYVMPRDPKKIKRYLIRQKSICVGIVLCLEVIYYVYTIQG